MGDPSSARSATSGDWRARAEQFFAVVVRARFATSDPELRLLLEREGLSPKHTKPLSIMEAINSLSRKEGFGGIRSQYDRLSDFVHHNLSSQVTVTAGVFNSTVARHHRSGGAILTPRSGPVVRYQYPVPYKAYRAIEETIWMTFSYAESSRRWILLRQICAGRT
jgi:hypothetical protein